MHGLPHDYAALALLGGLVLVLVYLTIQVQAVREEIQQVTGSSLGRLAFGA